MNKERHRPINNKVGVSKWNGSFCKFKLCSNYLGLHTCLWTQYITDDVGYITQYLLRLSTIVKRCSLCVKKPDGKCYVGHSNTHIYRLNSLSLWILKAFHVGISTMETQNCSYSIIPLRVQKIYIYYKKYSIFLYRYSFNFIMFVLFKL